ncbi:hypothetical protein C5167_036949 [Papaver somniferum]|uniref:Uncharacterized protein n=1 Tax=Papaver somniferum TaxID=3469 RepID=A0A4Y7I9C6_PAPSO|nr:hypothetical protein C5167_036949 [Papaver somniferum]
MLLIGIIMTISHTTNKTRQIPAGFLQAVSDLNHMSKC